VNEALRAELVAMRAEDLRVREELLGSGQLGNGYSPTMEAVHRRNAQRLREIVAEYGWPDTELAGSDGTLAAWFITQHAIGEPDFQCYALALIQESKARRGASGAGGLLVRPCCYVRRSASALWHAVATVPRWAISPLDD
jgi:hypothetical protein